MRTFIHTSFTNKTDLFFIEHNRENLILINNDDSIDSHMEEEKSQNQNLNDEVDNSVV